MLTLSRHARRRDVLHPHQGADIGLTPRRWTAPTPTGVRPQRITLMRQRQNILAMARDICRHLVRMLTSRTLS